MVYKKTNKRTHNLNEAIKKFSLIFQFSFYFPPMTEQNCDFFKVVTSDCNKMSTL